MKKRSNFQVLPSGGGLATWIHLAYIFRALDVHSSKKLNIPLNPIMTFKAQYELILTKVQWVLSANVCYSKEL